jgi:hypothetical protein
MRRLIGPFCEENSEPIDVETFGTNFALPDPVEEMYRCIRQIQEEIDNGGVKAFVDVITIGVMQIAHCLGIFEVLDSVAQFLHCLGKPLDRVLKVWGESHGLDLRADWGENLEISGWRWSLRRLCEAGS